MEEGAREIRHALGPGGGCCAVFFAWLEMTHQYFLSNAIWGFICTLPHFVCWSFSFCYHWHVPPPLVRSDEVIDLEGDSSEEEYDYEGPYGPPRGRQRNLPTWGRIV